MADDGEEEKNIAAWLLGIKTLKLQPYHLPSLGPQDVKVQIKALGICGSDVHHFKTMRCANFIVKKPMVIGHECAGIIEEVGSEVKSLQVGDRVALEPGISCGRCSHCKNGSYNLCPEMKFFGSPPTNGSLAHKVVHPANLCFKLPDNVSLEEGAMLGYLLAARAFGAPKIAIADVDVQRLSIAKNLGADETIQVSTDIKDVAAEVIKIQNQMGSGIDVSFDCVGFEKTMSTALNATRSGGKVCLIGLAKSEMTISLTPAAAREVDVIGIFRYRNTWPLCLDLLRTGKINVKPLITHRFGFSQKDVEDAFETSAHGGTAIKVMFNL
ncbi:hypothetical protein JRO89_XS11G0181300 [Xanthoceras sorbifolium]|uniref:Enoyl reductase (ER) domain-containing protein n=1 Tax=Xanthoceras sorbifolium TaxID=99658 RepID=A0ABQ8HG22_9ROSI|nr:hypothetical protein JRO89_XS11G0181300 [Xanthoceras sorbifolium]